MKTNEIFFEETQQQNQKWIAYLILVLALLNAFMVFQQLVLKIPAGNNPAPDWVLPLFLIIPLGMYILMKKNILLTVIDTEGIKFKYKPWHKSYKVIKWNDIDKCYVRLYSPIREYGGWGLRTAFTRGHGKAYNVSGKYGVQLELKDGARVLIGTQQPEAISKVLKAINI